MHRVYAIGNSPRVSRKLTEGIGSLPGWCKRVRQKKIEICWKIIGGSPKACREFGLCGAFRREFVRRFTEGIRKLARNTLGDHQGEDQKTCRKYTGGYRIGES
ncbi:hypothetical protein B296_00005386 [Ensete ventricosum]|uniref:Uncharacterized protein n=1 Tax=Ensete ventricosum TaxID=4639 RepID=A0A426ZFM1_ENSVE|nr:hypothetical protein B296_00005386 [Ensete ventricosum]